MKEVAIQATLYITMENGWTVDEAVSQLENKLEKENIGVQIYSSEEREL